MKKKAILLALSFTVVLFGTTSCKKENVTVDATLISEQTRQGMQKALVGSWQIAEKGVEVAMHDGHICQDPTTMAADKLTYAVQWEKVENTDRRTFKSNGDYSQYLNATFMSQGTFTVSNHAVLEIKSDNQSSYEKIEELTSSLLTISQGTLHYKFRKLD